MPTLEELRDHYVFESSPTRHDLGALHVPFDDLVGDHRTERRLDGAVRRQERAALIGPSGCGKSSVLARVLGSDIEGVAPLIVPLAALPATTIDTPSHLVDHLLATVIRQAGVSTADLDADVASHTEIVTTTKRGGLAAGWGWLKGELAREVKRQTEIERHASLIDKTDALAKVLELITHDDLQPVLVFDDTDRWLSNGGPALMRSFFSEGVRWLLELPASLVVAVHPHYFTDLPQQQLLQYIDTQITIPQITNPGGIEAILARRIELYADTDKPDLRSVFTDDAVIAVHNVYTDSGSLRRAIQICHTAVHDALDAGLQQVTKYHIQAAANAG